MDKVVSVLQPLATVWWTPLLAIPAMYSPWLTFPIATVGLAAATAQLYAHVAKQRLIAARFDLERRKLKAEEGADKRS